MFLCIQELVANEQTKCQSIFCNLLLARGVAQNQSACVYIRKLQHTAQCDSFCAFYSIRTAYSEVLGKERMAEQAITHYHDWTERNLVSALSWPNWMWYHTVHKAERMVAVNSCSNYLCKVLMLTKNAPSNPKPTLSKCSKETYNKMSKGLMRTCVGLTGRATIQDVLSKGHWESAKDYLNNNRCR